MDEVEKTILNSDDEGDTFVDALDTFEPNKVELTTNVTAPSQKKCSLKPDDSEQESSSTLSSEEVNALLGQDSDTDGDSYSGSEHEDVQDTEQVPPVVEPQNEESVGDVVQEALGGTSDPTEQNNEVVIDEEVIRQKETLLSEEEKEARRTDAQGMKEEGNIEFKSSNFAEAIEKYTAALTLCPMCYEKERSVMYSNRAACKFRLEKYEGCAEDCSKALELNPNYLKALVRRAECYERSDKLDDALEDYTKALEMDPSLHSVREACMRLPDQIKERNEKMKEEMLGKLKDLGNLVLRPFGLSTNNFQLQQNEAGGYSVNFVQTPQSNNNGNNNR